jgi:hypothetical protein
MKAQFDSFWAKNIADFEAYKANEIADFEAYMAQQKAAWEAFLAISEQEGIVPIPAPEDKGKAVMVNENGDGYTLAEIQTDIPVTSAPPEGTDLWIDPDDETVEESHLTNYNNPHKVTAEQIGLKTENWTFTLEDGSTVTKAVYVG